VRTSGAASYPNFSHEIASTPNNEHHVKIEGRVIQAVNPDDTEEKIRGKRI